MGTERNKVNGFIQSAENQRQKTFFKECRENLFETNLLKGDYDENFEEYNRLRHKIVSEQKNILSVKEFRLIGE